MTGEIRIALIDDDEAVLDSLRLYFTRHKTKVSSFSASQDFLAAIGRAEQFDCIVCDIRMPGISGLELLDRLNQLQYGRPIIFITGHGDVPLAVAAIKKGAFDFLNKPFDAECLLASVQEAVKIRKQADYRVAELEELRSRFAALSTRQRQVMDLVVAGLSNKEIGLRLKISPKTVDHHRAWVMERMGARNLAELVRLAVRIQGQASAP
jgi:FixJ family two-component response regulator